MKIQKDRLNHFLYGLLLGLIVPVVFIWLYLERFFPLDLQLPDMVRQLYAYGMLEKVLLLAAMPDMALLFVFYKLDMFRFATGVLIGGIPFLVASIYLS